MLRTMIRLLEIQAACMAAALLVPGAALADAGEERAAVIQAMQDWERAVEARNYDELATFYTEDAIYYPNNAPAIVGREAIIASNRARGTAATLDIAQQVKDVKVNGNWAVYNCLAEISLSEADDHVASTRHVRVLLVMQKGDDGRWRIFRDIDNAPPERPN